MNFEPLGQGDPNIFHFFWDGPFSQWYKSPMTIGGVTYNCAEQYMMAEKAELFNDIESLNKIMDSKYPAEQKAIGRTVKGFDIHLWEKNAKLIVYRGNLAKFTQSDTLREFILDTGDKWIVEASPEDRIWGIGMADNHPNILDPTKWQGTNWLGEVLMAVREDIVTMEEKAFAEFYGK